MTIEPDTKMLISGMEILEAYGLGHATRPGRQNTGQPDIPGKGENPSEEAGSGIIFLNQAYDSRKTGIEDSSHTPSVYRLCMGTEFLSFTCRQINTRPHRHVAIQLAFNFETPLLLRIQDSREFRLFFFIIPANIPHQLTSPAGKHFTILLDPLSIFGKKLWGLFADKDLFIPFARSVIDTVYPYIQTRLAGFESVHFVTGIIDRLTRVISGLPAPPTDPRIEHAVNHCRASAGNKLGAEDLAQWTALSQSRARHLFKAETGITFRQYLKWLKLMETFKHSCTAGGNLTQAAHMAGFSDSAHLSRTFREVFGLMPSAVLK